MKLSLSNWKSRHTSLLMASAALATGLMLPLTAQAGTAQIVDVEQGATAFLAYAGAFYNGGTIATVSYSILPLNGSVTRPLSASYSASYLSTHNYFIPGANAVVIPIFGLYSGSINTVSITYAFTDGTKNTQTTTIKTPVYTDPCAPINQRTFLQRRPYTNSLTFDYYLLKDYCSANSPAIFDTDGNIRWVGDAGDEVQDSAFFNNAIFFSDGVTGVKRMDITNGSTVKLADYASIGVTLTNQHNMDIGKTGLLLEVNTTTQTEATILEISPTTGAVLNTWDMGAIISAAITAANPAANPATLVQGTAGDWFHNNAATYNPTDNTLIVSSRENFVVAVDYNAPATGQRKIHWILGDPTKLWHSFAGLAQYALTPGSSSTVLPVGQHAVSIDHLGNLLLFDDGLGSLTLTSAPGVTRSYSAARSYTINTTNMTATEVLSYTAANNNTNLFSPICGSVYDVNGNYLVDFTSVNSAATAGAQSGATPGAIVGTLTVGATAQQTATVLVGVDGSSNIQFVSAIPDPGACSSGWNAVPLPSNVFTFN